MPKKIKRKPKQRLLTRRRNPSGDPFSKKVHKGIRPTEEMIKLIKREQNAVLKEKLRLLAFVTSDSSGLSLDQLQNFNYLLNEFLDRLTIAFSGAQEAELIERIKKVGKIEPPPQGFGF